MTYSDEGLRAMALKLSTAFKRPFTRKGAARVLGLKLSGIGSTFAIMSRAGYLQLAGHRGKRALYTIAFDTQDSAPSACKTTKRSKTTKTAKPAGPAVILQLTLDGSTGAVQGTAVSGSDYKAAQEAVGVARKRMQELETENAELKQKLANVTKALALV